MRWRVFACISLLAAVGPVPVARAATVPVLVIDGKGWGHGVGMAQDGAYWMGVAGASANQILGHFYAGTGIGRANGTVHVAVLDVASRDTVVAFPNGGEVRDAQSGPQATGFPVSVGPGGTVRVWFDGAYHAQAMSGATRASAAAASPSPPAPTYALASNRSAASFTPTVAGRERVAQQLPTSTVPPNTTTTKPLFPTPTTKPVTPTTKPPSAPPPTQPPPAPGPAAPTAAATSGRPLWSVPAGGGVTGLPARGRSYRGVISMTATGPLHFVNHVDVEQYLRGMGEVRNPSWPQASLKTQAIAARTYALRSTGGELCDYDRCQVYLGASAEYAAMDKAVNDSKGQVVTYGGGLATTVYSANAGGFSATPVEGFGGGSANFPYLKAQPYTTKDPDPWTVRIALTDLGARFGGGALTGAHIAQAGPSGRALSVSLDGASPAKLVDGLSFARGLGLRSTLFTLRIEQADVAPPAPAPADLIQAPPDQAVIAPPPQVDTAAIAPPLPQAPVKIVLPHDGGNGGAVWVGLACLLLATWALAATHFGIGIVPAPVRGRVVSLFGRGGPSPPAK